MEQKNFPTKAQRLRGESSRASELIEELPQAAVGLARENPVLTVLSFVALGSLALLWLFSSRD